MKDNIIVQFENKRTGEECDLEIPLTITANELIYALNTGMHLGIHLEEVSQCYLTSENPIALLKGNQLLKDYGLHDGTKIIFTR